MKLTRRQQMFLGKFLDLYHQGEKPLHYTTVAEYLGVNPITAYDMLRLLEGRGLLKSDYVPPSQREGTGRSIVVFRPTPAAQALLDEMAGGDWDREGWEAAKARILRSLREGRGTDYHDMLDDVLGAHPRPANPDVVPGRDGHGCDPEPVPVGCASPGRETRGAPFAVAG